MTKLSIIIPSYNTGDFIEETILSVINQNYNNLELILIDGNSSDNTIEIIKKYEKYFTYWVSEKDRGQSHAINKGFLQSTGELVTWLGADDVLTKDSLSHIIKAFKNYSEGSIFYGNIFKINEKGAKITDVLLSGISYETLLNEDSKVVQPGSFCNRKYLNEYFVDEELHYCMDYELWLRLGQKGKIVYINNFLASFRLHENSKSTTSIKKFIKEKIKIQKKFNKKFINKVIVDCYYQLGKEYIKHNILKRN
jgi:glycosyltransferase involved in cell wall biosynthesis